MKTDYGRLFLLMNKRLLRKKSYIIILCMIPVIVFGLKLISERHSGIVRIAMVNQGSDDAAGIIDELLNKDSVFLFSEAPDEETGTEWLKDNRIDAVWVFPKDYNVKTGDFADRLITSEKPDKGGDDRVVTVIEREDNVLLSLSRLELFGALYSDLSYSLFDRYISIRFNGGVDAGTDVRRYYDNDVNTNELFDYRNSNDDNGMSSNYLIAPLRGILLLIVLLCGLAAAMYYRDDMDKEIFVWMPVGNRWVFEHVYLLTALINGALVVFITFLLTGLVESIAKEIILMLIFIPASCCFCCIVRRLTFNLRSLATLIPILMLAMLVICPVFIYIRELHPLQILCPPFYYLMALNDAKYLNFFVIYTGATIAVDVLLGLGSRCSS